MCNKDSVNEQFLRQYNQPMPAKIVIRNRGYKRFKNVTVHTKDGFRSVSIDTHITVMKWS